MSPPSAIAPRDPPIPCSADSAVPLDVQTCEWALEAPISPAAHGWKDEVGKFFNEGNALVMTFGMAGAGLGTALCGLPALSVPVVGPVLAFKSGAACAAGLGGAFAGGAKFLANVYNHKDDLSEGVAYAAATAGLGAGFSLMAPLLSESAGTLARFAYGTSAGTLSGVGIEVAATGLSERSLHAGLARAAEPAVWISNILFSAASAAGAQIGRKLQASRGHGSAEGPSLPHMKVVPTEAEVALIRARIESLQTSSTRLKPEEIALLTKHRGFDIELATPTEWSVFVSRLDGLVDHLRKNKEALSRPGGDQFRLFEDVRAELYENLRHAIAGNAPAPAHAHPARIKPLDEIDTFKELFDRGAAVEQLRKEVAQARQWSPSSVEDARLQQMDDELSAYLKMAHRHLEAIDSKRMAAQAPPPLAPVGANGAPLDPKVRPLANVPPLKAGWPERYPPHEIPPALAHQIRAGAWELMRDRDIAMFGLFSHSRIDAIPPHVVDRALQNVTGKSRFSPDDFLNIGEYQRLLLGDKPPPTRDELLALLPDGFAVPDVRFNAGTPPSSGADVPVVTMADYYDSLQAAVNPLEGILRPGDKLTYFGQVVTPQANRFRAEAFTQELELDGFVREAIDDAMHQAGNFDKLPAALKPVAQSLQGEPKLKVDYTRTEYLTDPAALTSRIEKAQATAEDLKRFADFASLLEDAPPEFKQVIDLRLSEAQALAALAEKAETRLKALLIQ